MIGAMVLASFTDICVRDVAASIDFYGAVLGLEVLVDHGWYAEMGAGGAVLIAFVRRGHETLPPPARSESPAGVLVSFVVDDVDTVAAAVAGFGCQIVQPLTSELGQRHLMVLDPDGAVVDVIERVPLTAADRRRLVQLRRGQRVSSP